MVLRAYAPQLQVHELAVDVRTSRCALPSPSAPT